MIMDVLHYFSNLHILHDGSYLDLKLIIIDLYF